jgi:hypothetical protein
MEFRLNPLTSNGMVPKERVQGDTEGQIVSGGWGRCCSLEDKGNRCWLVSPKLAKYAEKRDGKDAEVKEVHLLLQIIELGDAEHIESDE